MSMHTPAPWTPIQRGDEVSFYGNTPGRRLVCWAQVMRGDEQAKADAKLIEAAPDLLAALIAVLHWIDDNCETTGFATVEAQADAALEKAGAELFNAIYTTPVA